MTWYARVALTTLVVGGLLTGCGAVPEGVAVPDGTTPAPAPVGPTETPSESPTGSTVPTPEDVRTQGVVVQVDGRTVLHALSLDRAVGVTTRPDADATLLAADPGASRVPVTVALAGPPDASLALQDDGSFVVLAPDGSFVGGAARPVTAEGGAPVTVTDAGQGLLRASADAGVLQIRVGGRALLGVEWGEREGGRSLAVAPSPWARHSGQAGELGVWTELVAAVPEADTPVMRDQLTCHVLGAPDKARWNLEPWRPDVGLFAVLAAACNPA